jgi:hypothetical protein
MRHIIGSSVLALFALATGDASAGSITYNIVNMPEYQSGYTVTGTITTDGTIGDVSDHITAWSFQFSSSPLSSTSLYSQMHGFGGVIATATELYLVPPPPPPAEESGFVFDGYDPVSMRLDLSIGWAIFNGPEGPGTALEIQVGEDVGPSVSPGPALNPNWVIATASVPEPSTLIMIGIATVCLVGGKIGGRSVFARKSK